MKRRMALVDYGSGNLRSVAKALEKVGAEVTLADSKEDLVGAEALVVPGVGAFGDCVDRLRQTDFWDALRNWLEEGKPYLGICLGYQLLFESSEENPQTQGLGFLKGVVRRFSGKDLKVPHMGWNTLDVQKSDVLMRGIATGSYAYFVHSYYPCPEEDITASLTTHGCTFSSAIEKNHVFATQFHPEKSQDIGLKILHNFVTLK